MRNLGILLLAACADGGSGGEPTDESAEVPVWAHEDLEPVGLGRWRLGILADAGNDVVRTGLEQGTYGFPDEGVDADGTRWVQVQRGENGTLRPANAPFVWALNRQSFAAGERLVGRANRALDLMIGTAAQPGYFYGERNRLIPLPVREDGDRVAVRAFGGRPFEVEVWRTTAELWLNTDDVTPVDFVVGEAQAQPIAIPVLNLTLAPLRNVVARVVDREGSAFAPTEHRVGTLPAAAVTHVPFDLVLRAPPTKVDEPLSATLRVTADGLDYAYEREVVFPAREAADGGNYWRTFTSPVDGSVQSFGVRQPSSFDPEAEYSLILSLHGAGVGAKGQSAAYGAKDWAYVVAPTNRHPFGFDWEEWGRANAIATLDHAMGRYAIDPTRVYLTGHSMGGHGTWHVGVTTPGRFATLAPSAGWESFYSYGGSPRPTGAFARARAHSDTLVYLENLARRGVYIIHGDADDNVPVSEGRRMFEEVSAVSDEVVYHEEPGAGHWWDGDPAPGAACVDFPPMMAWVQDFTLDPHELEFAFRSPSPGYTAEHSVVTLQSAVDGGADVVVEASVEGDTWVVTTDNARSLTIDSGPLIEAGLTTVRIDGEDLPLPETSEGAEEILVGPTDGKRHDVHGPFSQVMRAPFCFVYPADDGPWSRYAGWLASFWSNLASGSACAVPVEAVDESLRAGRNLIWVGVDEDVVQPTVDVGWGPRRLRVGGETYASGVMYVVFPSDGRLHAAIVGTRGHEHDVFDVNPISSRGGLPDVFVYERGRGTVFAAMFNGDWSL